MIKRPPDIVIRSDGRAYLRRWHLIPRNRFFNLYLHNFVGNDPQGLHDHPWGSLSIMLKGGLREEFQDGTTKVRRRGSVVYRAARHLHRLSLMPDGRDTWTLFITGPMYRRWGFFPDSSGWTYWENYVDRREDGRL